MYGFPNIFEWLSRSACRDTGLQSKSGCGYEGSAFRVLLGWSAWICFLLGRTYNVADEEGLRSVTVITVEIDCNVDVDDIAIF